MDIFKLLSFGKKKTTEVNSKIIGTKIENNSDNLIEKSKRIKLKKLLYIDKVKYKKFAEQYINFPGLKPQGRWKKILKVLENDNFIKD